MTRLPLELLIQVIEQLNEGYAVLKTLSLVCSAFRVAAHRCLFRSVIIEQRVVDIKELPNTIQSLLDIPSSNSISHYIRNIYVKLSGTPPVFTNALAKTLCATPNLERLNISVSYMGLPKLAPKLPFQLKHFGTNLGFADGFCTFIRSQPSLQSIDWESSEELPSDVEPFSAECLPHLKRLTVSKDYHLKMFLPQCHVSHLTIKNIDEFENYGVSLSVRGLTVGAGLNGERISGLAKFFPLLEILDIYVGETVSVPLPLSPSLFIGPAN